MHLSSLISRFTGLHKATSLLAALLLTMTAVGCARGAGEDAGQAAAPAEEAAPAVEAISYDPAILDVAGRSDDDHYRDAGMKPLQLYAFFGVEPGMMIGDLSTSGMYNAHILAQIAAADGKVYAIAGLGDSVSERGTTRVNDAFALRNVDGVLSNVEIVGTLEDLPENSLDMLITVRNYHDFGEREVRVANVARMLRVLKPGGILGAVDAHTDKTDERDESVHRLNEELARQEIVEGGFEFVGASELLYNAEDTFDFDGREGLRTPDDPSDDAPIHRYYIHRWALKFQKPMQ